MDFAVSNHSQHWVAYRRVTSDQDKLGEAIGAPSVLPGIYELAGRYGVKASVPYARYIDWRETDCDLQVGVVLSAPIPPEGDIIVDLYSACRVVTCTFVGPYSEMREPWDGGFAYRARARGSALGILRRAA